jgi:glycosyltransferase involved in cell wall biosynthesis
MDRRIRIVQMITELRPSGAERCVFELTRRLDPERFDVRVLSLRGGQVAGWLARLGYPVEVLGLRGRWDAGKFVRLLRALRWWRPDVLHTHLFHADLVGRSAAALVGVPHLVHSVHVAEGRFRPWQFAWARFTADACDRIVCVSPDVRDHHARLTGLPTRRYTVIPNGIDVDAYTCDPGRRQSLRRQWGVGEDRCLLAFVGRLDPQKGVDVLISALSHLGARREPMDVVIAGEGPLEHIVRTYAEVGEGGGRCRVLGYVHNVADVYSAADALVLPSRWEGFGLVAAEAMAAGLPVIGTNVPGLGHVVVHGETGLLVPPDDVQTLADAMAALAADEDARARYGEAGLERVRRLYDIDRNVAQHAELYEEIVRPR